MSCSADTQPPARGTGASKWAERRGWGSQLAGVRPGCNKRPKPHPDVAPVGAGTAGWLLAVPIGARNTSQALPGADNK